MGLAHLYYNLGVPNDLTFTSYDAPGNFDANTVGNNYKFAIIKVNLNSGQGSNIPSTSGILVHFMVAAVGGQLFISKDSTLYYRRCFTTWGSWVTVSHS